jgi:hypothetical protein
LGDFVYDSVFFMFFCKPVDVVEGISLRASCFDGGMKKKKKGKTPLVVMTQPA